MDEGISIILAIIRMHCSKVNADLSSNNITDGNLCNCDDIEAFFFESPMYVVVQCVFYLAYGKKASITCA